MASSLGEHLAIAMRRHPNRPEGQTVSRHWHEPTGGRTGRPRVRSPRHRPRRTRRPTGSCVPMLPVPAGRSNTTPNAEPVSTTPPPASRASESGGSAATAISSGAPSSFSPSSANQFRWRAPRAPDHRRPPSTKPRRPMPTDCDRTSKSSAVSGQSKLSARLIGLTPCTRNSRPAAASYDCQARPATAGSGRFAS